VGKCFVIQPFDGGKYDKRYKDVIKPAIEKAGLEPYRVDKDPSVLIPIEEIEANIRASVICVAEITDDNPNVWYEVGYAFAVGKRVVLLCVKDRPTPFPFDVRHRLITTYVSESSSDFAILEEALFERIKALIALPVPTPYNSNAINNDLIDGLTMYEVAIIKTMIEIVTEPYNSVASSHIRDGLKEKGINSLGYNIGLHSLVEKNYIYYEAVDTNLYYGASLTLMANGLNWLAKNSNVLNLSHVEIDDEADPFADE